MGPRATVRDGVDLPHLRGGEDRGGGKGPRGEGRGPPSKRHGGLGGTRCREDTERDEPAERRRDQVHAPLSDDPTSLQRGPEDAVDLAPEETDDGGDEGEERDGGDRGGAPAARPAEPEAEPPGPCGVG